MSIINTRIFFSALLCFILTGIILTVPIISTAQNDITTDSATTSATTTATSTVTAARDASSTASGIISQRRAAEQGNNDVTQPEELTEKVAIINLIESRLIEEPNLLTFFAYWVQQAILVGVPANTIFLILLTPLLATLVSFVRVVVGLPTLDMFVPIALAFTFVSVGVLVGLMILAAIILASYISKMMLSGARIMFYPKRSLSMLFLAIFVFGALSIALALDFERVVNLSIFPLLILMLLGDSIVTVQLHKSASETFMITTTTLCLGLLGFVLASSTLIQNTLILYPELVLLAIPVNLLIGRYFGLRFLEYFRFGTLS